MSLASYRDAKVRSCDRMRARYDSPRLHADGTPVAGVWQGNMAPLFAHVAPTGEPWVRRVMVVPVLPHDVDEFEVACQRMTDAGYQRMPGGPSGTSADAFLFYRSAS